MMYDLGDGTSRVPHRLRAGVDQAPILTGRLKPGQALVETELAAQFGVSKTPVREALKTLAGTGLVVMSQYKGVTVRIGGRRHGREVYDVRLLLEPEALRRTVSSGADFGEAARDVLPKRRRRPPNGPWPTGSSTAPCTPCGNPLLVRMLDEVRDQAALVSVVGWGVRPSWDREAAEHREILRPPSTATPTARRPCCATTSRPSPTE